MDGRIILEVNGKIIGQEQGEILFTEYGISGISVFQLSRYAVRGAAEGKNSCLSSGSDAKADKRRTRTISGRQTTAEWHL